MSSSDASKAKTASVIVTRLIAAMVDQVGSRWRGKVTHIARTQISLAHSITHPPHFIRLLKSIHVARLIAI